MPELDFTPVVVPISMSVSESALLYARALHVRTDVAVGQSVEIDATVAVGDTRPPSVRVECRIGPNDRAASVRQDVAAAAA